MLKCYFDAMDYLPIWIHHKLLLHQIQCFSARTRKINRRSASYSPNNIRINPSHQNTYITLWIESPTHVGINIFIEEKLPALVDTNVRDQVLAPKMTKARCERTAPTAILITCKVHAKKIMGRILKRFLVIFAT